MSEVTPGLVLDIFLSMYTMLYKRWICCYEGGSEGKFEERWRERFEGGGAANLPPPGEPSRSQVEARQLHRSRNWQSLHSDSSVFTQK